MRLERNLLLWAQILLSGLLSTAAPLPLPAGTSVSPHQDLGNEAPQFRDVPKASETTIQNQTEGTVHSKNFTITETLIATTQTPVAMAAHFGLLPSSVSAAVNSLSSLPPTDPSEPLTGVSLTTFTSQSSHSDPGVSVAVAPSPLKPPSELTHQKDPPEFSVGDEEQKRPPHPQSPLDPLLATLLSAFIVVTAIVFVILFLNIRHKTNHPEFHRLQDLPMDDLLEDTPLSRYSY